MTAWVRTAAASALAALLVSAATAPTIAHAQAPSGSEATAPTETTVATETPTEATEEAAGIPTEDTSEPSPDLAELQKLLEQLLQQLLGDAGLDDLADAAQLLPCIGDASGDPQPISEADGAGQVEEIAQRVEEIRGHEFGQEVTTTFVTADEMDQRVSEIVAAEYTAEQADTDRRVLSALGAVPADVDLRALQEELLSGQVAGYYDSKTGELFVLADESSSGLDPVAQITLAHELTHALTDQAFGLPDEVLGGTTDAALAALAFVEGDAILTQQQFSVAAIPVADQLALITDPRLFDAQAALEQVPSYLRSQLEFPYLEGAGFACDLYQEGGWDAVDAAYGDLPTTTAQILFPERGDPAARAPVPTTPSTSWRHVAADTFGAAQLLWLFEAPGGDPGAALDDPLGEVESWAGGRVDLWVDGSSSAVSLTLTDVAADGALCDAVAAWYAAAFPEDQQSDTAAGTDVTWDGADQDAALRCAGHEVRLGIGPDPDTAGAILGEPPA